MALPSSTAVAAAPAASAEVVAPQARLGATEMDRLGGQIGCGRQLRQTSQSPDCASVSKACSKSVSVASESEDVREKCSSSSSEGMERSELSSSSGASSTPRTKTCSFRSRSRGEGDELSQ
jgi:hypothetical protein